MKTSHMKSFKVISVIFFLIFALLALCPSQSQASGVFVGKIKGYMVGPNHGNLFFITVDGSVTSPPTCSNNQNFQFVFDVTSPNAKIWISVLQTAHALNKTVNISGMGDCALYPDTGSTDGVETFGRIWVKE